MTLLAGKATADALGKYWDWTDGSRDTVFLAWMYEFTALVLFAPFVQLLALVTTRTFLWDPQPVLHTVDPRHWATYTDGLEERFASFAEECSGLRLVTLADECVSASGPLVAVLDAVWRWL